MGFFGRDNLTEAESGNWNTAENYSQIKIMNLLAISDEYEELAEFGSLNLFDEVNNTAHTEELKIRGFRRLINHLIRVCNNSWFALEKHKTAQTNIENYITELKEIRNNIGALFVIATDEIHKTRQLKILPLYYEKLERVSEIKKEINKELNEGDLIFIHKDNFDAKDYKKRIFEDAISRG
jgi:hypothetical protein